MVIVWISIWVCSVCSVCVWEKERGGGGWDLDLDLGAARRQMGGIGWVKKLKYMR